MASTLSHEKIEVQKLISMSNVIGLINDKINIESTQLAPDLGRKGEKVKYCRWKKSIHYIAQSQHLNVHGMIQDDVW